jgi:hypothetical protein
MTSDEVGINIEYIASKILKTSVYHGELFKVRHHLVWYNGASRHRAFDTKQELEERL